MPSVKEALLFPIQGEDRYRPLLFGGGLTLFAFLLVPMVFVLGYLVRVIDARRQATDADPPRFEDWREIFIDGLAATGLFVGYMGLPVSLYVASPAGTLSELLARPDHLPLLFPAIISRAAVQTSLGAPPQIALPLQRHVIWYVLLSFLVYSMSTLAVFAFYYLAGAAIANYARTRQLRASFQSDVLRLAARPDYALVWVVLFVAFLPFMLLRGLLRGVPFVGTVFNAFLFFYVLVVAAGLVGDSVRAFESAPGQAADYRISSDMRVDRSVTGWIAVDVSTANWGSRLAAGIRLLDMALIEGTVLAVTGLLILWTLEGIAAVSTVNPIPLWEAITEAMLGTTITIPEAKTMLGLLLVVTVGLKTAFIGVKVIVSTVTDWHPPEHTP